ncbi:hypothetical protein WJX84_010648 [Apatococcus fuscideae]|uniref:Uncharacterized protein n=1 Tax=Apatococcus fuscideae TaxID=2026836 RepID=A0AAW1SUI4_9CHLO
MELVHAGTPQEQLLLTLIDKMEENTSCLTRVLKAVHSNPALSETNPLRDFKPPAGYTVIQEAQWLEKRIKDEMHRDRKSHTTKTVSVLIAFPENIELLRENGFQVSRTHTYNFIETVHEYAVSWAPDPHRHTFE